MGLGEDLAMRRSGMRSACASAAFLQREATVQTGQAKGWTIRLRFYYRLRMRVGLLSLGSPSELQNANAAYDRSQASGIGLRWTHARSMVLSSESHEEEDLELQLELGLGLRLESPAALPPPRLWLLLPTPWLWWPPLGL